MTKRVVTCCILGALGLVLVACAAWFLAGGGGQSRAEILVEMCQREYASTPLWGKSHLIVERESAEEFGLTWLYPSHEDGVEGVTDGRGGLRASVAFEIMDRGSFLMEVTTATGGTYSVCGQDGSLRLVLPDSSVREAEAACFGLTCSAEAEELGHFGDSEAELAPYLWPYHALLTHLFPVSEGLMLPPSVLRHRLEGVGPAESLEASGRNGGMKRCVSVAIGDTSWLYCVSRERPSRLVLRESLTAGLRERADFHGPSIGSDCDPVLVTEWMECSSWALGNFTSCMDEVERMASVQTRGGSPK